MPEYYFKHKETGEEIILQMKIAEYEEFKKEAPEWVPQMQSPSIVSGISKRPDKDFRDYLKRIKKANRYSRMRTDF